MNALPKFNPVYCRILIGLVECNQRLALPLSPSKAEDFRVCQRNLKQLFTVFKKPCDQSSRDGVVLAFVDSGGAEEYQRAHG